MWLLSGVGSHVSVQRRADRGNSGAEDADEGPLAGVHALVAGALTVGEEASEAEAAFAWLHLHRHLECSLSLVGFTQYFAQTGQLRELLPRCGGRGRLCSRRRARTAHSGTLVTDDNRMLVCGCASYDLEVSAEGGAEVLGALEALKVTS